MKRVVIAARIAISCVAAAFLTACQSYGPPGRVCGGRYDVRRDTTSSVGSRTGKQTAAFPELPAT